MDKSFTIIHPSRSRAGLAHDTAIKWLQSASKEFMGSNIEYIISVDIDDPQLPVYKSLFDGKQFKLIKARNNNVVQAMNSGARFAINDILVCISDDIEPCDNWDKLLCEAIDKDELAIQVNDGITNNVNSSYYKKFGHHELIMVCPVMTLKLYQKLGYVYYPEYTGMFADNDLAECCAILGVLKYCPDIQFTHRHFTNGMAQMDATYARHNNRQSWLLGEKIIERRRETKFGFDNQ